MDHPLTRAEDAWLKEDRRDDALILTLGGCWLISCAMNMRRALDRITGENEGRIVFDITELEDMDTTGAWLVHRTAKRLRDQGVEVEVREEGERYSQLIDQIGKSDEPCEIETGPRHALHRLAEDVGKNVVENASEARQMLAFLGTVVLRFLGCFLRPGTLRITPTVHHLEHVGFRALPIIGMMAFLIGVVITYISAQEFRELGGEVFVVDLLTLATLREIGIVITAIMVAGRSGSAFTAQIGSMKLHEEIDAMRALALDPIEILVMPRVMAMFIALPLLTFFADIVGLLGGGLICWAALDISPGMFVIRVQQAMDEWTFWIGMIKAPFLAVTIAVIGCFEGLQVRSSAESLGSRTTRSVVEAIFMIVVIDAIFAMFFNELGI